MPATMMHLLAGKEWDPAAGDEFLLGCILPDCVDADRALKDHLHFRDIAPAAREGAIAALGRTLDLGRAFNFGMLWHFYLDYLWDNGPQKEHRESYRGNDWFHDYRREIGLAGSYIAHSHNWARPLWERLRTLGEDVWKNDLGLTASDVASFLDFNYHWHTEIEIGPSSVFPPDLIARFNRDSIAAFRLFLEREFPEYAGKTDC